MDSLEDIVNRAIDDLCDVLKENIGYFHRGETDDPWIWVIPYESDDKNYEIRVSITSHDKHSCNDCIYLNGLNCLKGFRVNNWHYCRSYKTHKSCWECKHWQDYGYNESWCEIDIEENTAYSYDDNEDNKCPNWEWEGL